MQEHAFSEIRTELRRITESERTYKAVMWLKPGVCDFNVISIPRLGDHWFSQYCAPPKLWTQAMRLPSKRQLSIIDSLDLSLKAIGTISY